MKVVQINATCGIGSTGKICVDISKLMTLQNIENYILYNNVTNGYEFGKRYGGSLYVKFQAFKSRIFGNYGFNSFRSTQKIINHLEHIQPDIVHLHNIHGHDCDLSKLFTYFKEKKTKLIWTFHDCWAFTGYCTHFDMIGCDKWKRECSGCPQKKGYSWFFDRSNELFLEKKKLFEGLDLTVVTPSRWLADMVKLSFLGDYPVEVINNGIDLDVFKTCESNFRQNYGIGDKRIILGVSFGWSRNKGIDVFTDLANRLPDNYKIVLVGTDENIDKSLPGNILSIHRTKDQRELAEIYSAADLFVNATREDTYPTVNMEALACGTPVLTFNTGGSGEMIDNRCGVVVERDDTESLEREIYRICENKPFERDYCIKKSKGFDRNEKFGEYLELYRR